MTEVHSFSSTLIWYTPRVEVRVHLFLGWIWGAWNFRKRKNYMWFIVYAIKKTISSIGFQDWLIASGTRQRGHVWLLTSQFLRHFSWKLCGECQFEEIAKEKRTDACWQRTPNAALSDSLNWDKQIPHVSTIKPSRQSLSLTRPSLVTRRRVISIVPTSTEGEVGDDGSVNKFGFWAGPTNSWTRRRV